MERLISEVQNVVKTLKALTPEFVPIETRPSIGARYPHHDSKCSNDLVDKMEYIFVHVVKAINLPAAIDASTGSCINPYVEVKIGDLKASTKSFENEINPVWDQVFAFSTDQIRTLFVEVIIKDKIRAAAATTSPANADAADADAADPAIAVSRDEDFIGQVTFNENQIPKCDQRNKLAAQWYRPVSRAGEKIAQGSEILLAVWIGTQVDKSFLKAWHSDAASVVPAEYLVPQMWYVRVNVIEGQDLVLPRDRIKSPQVRVVAVLGNQTLRTRAGPVSNVNPLWNEDLMFVAAEPFTEELVLTVEVVGGLGVYEVLGRCSISLQLFNKRLDHRPINTRWYSLSKVTKVSDEYGQQFPRFSSRIHLRLSLEGGHRVLYEANTDTCSNFRPSARQLWKANVGVLKLGIVSAHGLLPMKTREGLERTDAYCVAMYGKKWTRTRTISNNCNPKWNEQCTWDVFDPYTIFTIGVFDDNNFQGRREATDAKIGMLRIRVSSLESDRVHRHKYPLLVVSSSGVRKMGEIELAVRYTCTAWFNAMMQYSQPVQPLMHYKVPLSVMQLNRLRDVAVEIISNRFDKAEPPLRREVVDNLLNVNSTGWSFRRSKANILRVTSILRWFDQVCKWKNPIQTMILYLLLTAFWLYPKLIPSTIFSSLALVCISRYRLRWSWHPPEMDPEMSQGAVDDPDELDEEFDTFPSSQTTDVVKKRYDRLRSEAGRIQTEVGEWAGFAERLQCLVTWTDHRITVLFLPLCVVAAVVCYYAQIKVVLILGFYLLRPPWLRFCKVPLAPINFFSRLPSKADQML